MLSERNLRASISWLSLLCAAWVWPAQAWASPAGDKTVEVAMCNVDYHFTDTVAVHIARLRGKLAPAGENEFPVFDDKQSFILRIESAEISISTQALANVLNSYVLARGDAPMKGLSISSAGDRLKIKGKLHSHGDMPFETEGELSATEDGKIRLHAGKIKALHLPVKGIMDLFGVEMADLVKTNKVSGIQMEKDDVLLDAAQILPPPHIEGRVSSVALRGNDIVMEIGTALATVCRKAGGNYMAYSGNRLRFGKLTMNDTDMVQIDMDPTDAFDFYLDHYKEQLAAGYTKITPRFGLRVYMRDYNKLGGQRKAAQKK